MEKKLLTIITLLFISISFGQKLDSIPYDYGSLYYHTYGQGEEILILSGGPGNNAMQLEKVATTLSSNNRIILLEQRGTGRSTPVKIDKSTVSIDSALNDINLVLDNLKIDKIVLLGHSYGVSLASIFASKYPERVKKLILVSPGTFDFDSAWVALCNIASKLGTQENLKWESLYSKSFTSNFSETEKKELKHLSRLAYVYNKSRIDYYLPLINGNQNIETNYILSTELLNYNFNLKIDLENINSPIHIISGRQDIFSFMTYEYKIARPDIEIHWIDESGHFPMYEQPKVFYSIIEKILE